MWNKLVQDYDENDETDGVGWATFVLICGSAVFPNAAETTALVSKPQKMFE